MGMISGWGEVTPLPPHACLSAVTSLMPPPQASEAVTALGLPLPPGTPLPEWGLCYTAF